MKGGRWSFRAGRGALERKWQENFVQSHSFPLVKSEVPARAEDPGPVHGAVWWVACHSSGGGGESGACHPGPLACWLPVLLAAPAAFPTVRLEAPATAPANDVARRAAESINARIWKRSTPLAVDSSERLA